MTTVTCALILFLFLFFFFFAQKADRCLSARQSPSIADCKRACAHLMLTHMRWSASPCASDYAVHALAPCHASTRAGRQVAERVRTDARVALLERTNLRYLELGQLPGGERVDLATLDLSFISVLKVLPAVCGLLAPGGALLVLIKPQFEAGRAQARAMTPAPRLCPPPQCMSRLAWC